MPEIRYIQSLHRPFNQNLNTTKWVCLFVDTRKIHIPKSEFYFRFYIYMINKLHKEYNKNLPANLTGLPSLEAINNVYKFLDENSHEDIITIISEKLKNRKTQIDRTIYSTYKACSYYINLAKDKFKLINDENSLTERGIRLIELRSNEFKLSKKEQIFFFEIILHSDFHLFLTNCYFQKIKEKYNLNDIANEQFNFLDKFFGIRHFNFTSASLENYNTVRNYWVKEIDVLDANFNIRKKNDLILKEPEFNNLAIDLKDKFKKYETSNLIKKKKYNTIKRNFLLKYSQCKTNELGFVNLYQVKKDLNISVENFQSFISEFYEQEKNNYNIFFNNIVNSIDKRKRFYIRNRPTLNIKIKKL